MYDRSRGGACPLSCIRYTLNIQICSKYLLHNSFYSRRIYPGLLVTKINQSWELQNGISFIPIGKLIWRLITRGEQALFNLEITKKRRSSIKPGIHYSKVSSSGLTNASFLNATKAISKPCLTLRFQRTYSPKSQPDLTALL